MAFIPLRQIGSKGIVTDQDPYDLELTQFPIGQNVQFHEGRIGKSFGHSSSTTVATAPTHLVGWRYPGNNTLIVGALNKIYRYNGASISNVTKTSDATNYGNSERWQSAFLGSALLMNNGVGTPQYMQPNGTRFADLPSWPANVITGCIKPYNAFLVMTGYETSGAKYPYTVRWSDTYNPTTVPSDYNIASTTNLAGENVLTGRYGNLIDQLPLNNANMIYAQRGVFAMDYIGSPLVFSFREVFTDDGIINRGAVATFFNQHLVVGNNDIYIHDGNSKRSIVDNRVRRTFYNAVQDTRSVTCTAIYDRSEVWITYADEDAASVQNANKALIYNWTQDAFTFLDLPNVRAIGTSDVLDTSGAWDNNSQSWDDTNEYWSNASLNTTSKGMGVYAVSPANNKVYQLLNTHSADGSPLNAYLEATKIDLDQVLGTATNNIKQIKGILPQMQGTGTVDIAVGTSMGPQDGISWQPPVVYQIEQDHKIDVRASGRYFALRIASNSASDYWRLTGLDIDVAEVSGR